MSAETIEIREVSLNGLECRFVATVPADGVKLAYNRVLDRAVKAAQNDRELRATLRGGLNTPIPPGEVKRMWGGRIRDHLIATLLGWVSLQARKALDQAWFAEPVFAWAPLRPGEAFTVKVRCFLVPAIPVSRLHGLVLPTPPTFEAETLVDGWLEELRAQGRVSTRQGEVGFGATPRVDVEIRLADGAPPLFAAVNVRWPSQAGALGAITETLVGSRVNETVEGRLSVSNGSAQARVRLAAVEKPAEWSLEQLAGELGLESREALRAWAAAVLTETFEQRAITETLDAAVAHVGLASAEPVPETLVKRWVVGRVVAWCADLSRKGVEPPPVSERDMDELLETFRGVASRSVARDLTVAALCRTLEVEVDTQQTRLWVARQARARRVPPKRLSALLEDSEALVLFLQRLTRERLVDALRLVSAP